MMWPVRMQLRRTAFIAAAGAAMMLMHGCAVDRQALDAGESAGVDHGARAAQLAAIINAHNARAADLTEFYGAGVVEIIPRDGGGDQGDFKLWVRQPRETALRIDKLSTVYLWLGSDEERYWLFDLVNQDEKHLLTRPHGQPLVFDGAGDAVLRLEPLMLLDLLSLTAVEFDETRSKFDETAGTWIVRGEGAAGGLRLYVAEGRTLPHRIEAVNPQDEVIAFSELHNEQTVRVPGRSLLNSPKMATLINLRSPQHEAEIRLQFESGLSTATLADQPADRVFDFDRIMKSLQPMVIDDGTGDPAGPGT